MRLVAGVDSSTQACKVVVADADTGRIVRQGRAPHPGGTEVDPEAWWQALQQALAEAGGLEGVSAIGIAGQQHGMVALDASGEVIRDALLWNDTRSAQAAADLTTEVGAGEYSRRTGLVPVASFTATKLRWLAENEPENAERIAAVALPHDWLLWRLRGYGPTESDPLGADLEELVTDRSEASGTAYFNSMTDSYDRELLARSLRRTEAEGITLPRVLEPDAHVPGPGWIASAGAGDNAAAGLGLGLSRGDVVISIGTSGTVFASAPTPVTAPSETVPVFADAAGGFLPIVTTLNAARVFDAIGGLLGVDNAELGALALQASPGAGGLVLQPWFEGERTPNRADATASLFNLTLATTTRENVARAAVEGVLCSLAYGVEALKTHGLPAERIVLIGGAAQNPAVQEIAAQVFAAPVVVPAPGEYVAHGAAKQASWALEQEMPEWPLVIERELPTDHVPGIYRAFRSHL